MANITKFPQKDSILSAKFLQKFRKKETFLPQKYFKQLIYRHFQRILKYRIKINL